MEVEKVPTWVEEIIYSLTRIENIEFVVAAYFSSKEKVKDSVDIPQYLPKVVPIIQSFEKADLKKILFSENTIKQIAHYNPDLILYFSTKIPSNNIAEISRYGAWSLCFGEANLLCDTSPGFWDWYYNKKRTQISLIRFDTHSFDGIVICEKSISTYRPSFTKNKLALFSHAASLIVEEVSELTKILSEEDKFHDKARKKIIITDKSFKPNYLHILKAKFKQFSYNFVKSIKEFFFDEDWVLFFDLKSIQTPSLDFVKFKVIIPPRDRFWADPFVVSKGGKHFIFFEEFIWKTEKGHLTCMVLDKNGRRITSQVILEKPYHLSYPFIFEHRGSFYMIPETSENNSIDLYECVEFPFNWKFKRKLISNINAVDATLFYHNNIYWIFCGVMNNSEGKVYDDLNIFYSDDLFGDDWIPHPKNPVVSNIKSARPAGKIFNLNGALCRPSQIGEPYYGYGLALNRITILDETNYKEENFLNIKPNFRKGLGSVHTINFSDKMTVTDGVLRRFRFTN